MNIIQKVTWKSMRQNKKRTIVTILGVAICVSMLTAISLITSSLYDALLRSAIADNGTKDFMLFDRTNKQANQLLKDKRVASTMRFSQVAYADIEDTSLYIVAIDVSDPLLGPIAIAKGTFPIKADEIVMDEAIRKSDSSTYKIGERITLPLYDIRYEGIDDFYKPTEVQEAMGTQTYTITGFVKYPKITMVSTEKIESGEQFYAFTNYDATPVHNKKTDIAVCLKDIKNFKKQLDSIAETYGRGGGYSINSTYLSLRGVDAGGVYSTFIPVLAVLICIILVGGVALIYNAFCISLSERSRYLGMLSSVGATKKQKRDSLLFEAFLIGIIAIPLGMLIGILGMSITFYFLNPYVASVIDIQNVSFQMVIDPRLLLFTVLFSTLIVVLSAWLPAQRASKITAISAIQQHRDSNIAKRNLKMSRITRKLCSVEAQLALKNMKRNRKRYRSTLSSLIVCIVLFMAAQFFGTTMSDTTGMMFNYTDADILLDFYASDTSSLDFNQKVFEEIRNLPSVKKSVFYGEDYSLFIKDTSQLHKEANEYLTQNENEVRKHTNLTKEDTLRPDLTLQILSDQDFTKYCKEIGCDPTKFDGTSSSVIVVNKQSIQEERKTGINYRTMQRMDVKPHDNIAIYSTQRGEVSDVPQESVDLQVEAIADQEPSFNKQKSNYLNLLFVCNYKSYVHLQQELANKGYEVRSPFYEIQFIAFDVNKLQSDIEKREPSFPYSMSSYNIAQQRIKNTQRNIFVNTMLYGFVVLILLVCSANIMNTISTSMELRKREFAMIKSIGITKRKFNQMICFETLFYGIKALLYGIPLGLAIVYVLYALFTREIFHFALILPIRTYIYMVIGIMVLLFATTFYAMAKLKHDNIVETIRKESI